MSDPTSSRPRQVTLAGWMLIVGSALAVLLVFDRVARLRSLENRESIERFVNKPPGSDLGISVDAVLTAMHTLAMVTAGCATAVCILGYQVLRRSRSARVAVTVLAVPLFLAGLGTGGFVTSVVAASAAMLWLQPARSWFAGEQPTAASGARAGVAATPVQTPAQTTAHTPAYAPSAPRAPAYPSAATRRPGSVLAACVLTWVFAGLTVVALLASAAVLALDTDLMLDEAHRQNPDLAEQGVSDDLLIAVTFVLLAGILAWCVAAAVVAVFALRRATWARITLIVSAGLCGALCLIGSALGAFVLLVPLIAALLTLGLLLRAEVARWYSTRALG